MKVIAINGSARKDGQSRWNYTRHTCLFRKYIGKYAGFFGACSGCLRYESRFAEALANMDNLAENIIWLLKK